jgi:hypothetical protein
VPTLDKAVAYRTAAHQLVKAGDLILVSLLLPDFNRKKACVRKCLRPNKGVIFI